MEGIRKSMLNRVLCMALSLLLLLSLLPQVTLAANTDRYGYTNLESAKEKKLYGMIVDAVEDCKDELSVSAEGFTLAELESASQMVSRDYPELFYYQTYGASHINGIVQKIHFQYVLNEQPVQGNSPELKAARAALDKKVNEIVKGATGDNYQKALYLHDYLVNNLIYQSTNNDQNAYGALIEGKAVCAGYSHAYQLLLRKVGIESFYITGESKGIDHAWLLVFLNDECYYTDVTWDDPLTPDGHQILGHYYFNMSYDDMSKDHITDPDYDKWLPKKHDHKDMYYFEHDAREGSGIGWFNSNTTPATLYNYLKKNGNTYYCDFRYDDANVKDWLEPALRSIYSQLGDVQGATYEQIGNEYMLTITTKAPSHTISKVKAKAATCQSEGNIEYYVCTTCNKYFKDANGAQEITDKSSVKIAMKAHTPGSWKSDANNHWKECTASGCNTVIAGTSAVHVDQNGDKRCDTCSYQLPSNDTTDPTNPTNPANPANPTTPTDPAEPIVPPVGDNTDPTEEVTEPTEEKTEPTQGETDPTEGSTPATEATTPSGDDTTDPTEPSAPAATDPAKPGDPAGDGELLIDPKLLIWAAGVVGLIGVIAVVISVVRKKRSA